MVLRIAERGDVPDFDDDEYDSFDLTSTGGRGVVAPAQRADLGEDSDDDLEDDRDEDLDDDFDDLEDATEDDVDFVIGVYREDGVATARMLDFDLANDFDELTRQVRRLPGDAGAIGLVALAGEMFLIVRVRGSLVQVVLSDLAAAHDWPLARDVTDYLGIDDLGDPDDDEINPLGDLALLADLGLGEFELEQIALDLDDDADEALLDVADRIHLGAEVRRVVEASGR